MDYAASRSHPLHTALGKFTHVAHVVLVPHMAVQHIGNRLEPTMRVRWKARDVVIGVFRAEFIEHQKRIEPQTGRRSQTPPQLHAGAVRGSHAGNYLAQFFALSS